MVKRGRDVTEGPVMSFQIPARSALIATIPRVAGAVTVVDGVANGFHALPGFTRSPGIPFISITRSL